MAEKELAILIRARDLASRTIGKVRKEIGVLGSAGSKAMAGLSTAMTRVGVAAASGLAAGVALGARSLARLERATNQTNAVLASTKGASGQTAESIRKHAEALEQLTTADDKAIQEGQNMLLTFTKIGGKTFPKATKAVVDMAIAMAKGDVNSADFAGTAIQVGKALNDPIKGVTALGKAGVSFTEQQKKQIKTLVEAGKIEQAQAIILKELGTEFGNAGKAAGTGFEADIRRVQDAGEDLTTALARGVMPALTRAAKWLSTKLADPAVVAQIEEIGRGLGDAAQAALDFIDNIDFAAVGRGLKTAADAAKTVVSLFMGLPDWVKTAVVSGWGLNKLTGGALSGVITGLAGGLVKGILGMNAGVVNIKAGVVNGAGGTGGGPTGGGGGASPALALTGITIAVEEAIRAGIEYGVKNTAMEDKGLNAAEIAAVKYYNSSIAEQQYASKRLGYVPTKADYISGTNKLSADVDGSTAAVERMRANMSSQTAKTVAAEARTAAAARAAGITAGVAAKNAGGVAKSGGLAAAAAIRAKRMSVNVRNTVQVSTAISVRDVNRTTVRTNRINTTSRTVL